MSPPNRRSPFLWMCGIQGQVRWGGCLLPKTREIIREGSFWVFLLPVFSAGLPCALVFASTWPWMKRLAGLAVCFGARAFLCVSGVFGFDCLREERRQTCALQNTHPGTVCSWEHLNTLVFHFKGRNQQIHSWYQMFDCIQNAHRHTQTQTQQIRQEDLIRNSYLFALNIKSSPVHPNECPKGAQSANIAKLENLIVHHQIGVSVHGS